MCIFDVNNLVKERVLVLKSNLGLSCLLFITFFLGPNSVFAVSKNFNSELIDVNFEKTTKISLNHPSWDKIPATQVKIWAQQTVPLNDKIVNKILNEDHGDSRDSGDHGDHGDSRDSGDSLNVNKERMISIKAIYNRSTIFLKIEWADLSQSLVSSKETNSYGDSVAIEIPKEFSERLPYVGMGDEKRNVYVYMQRAAEASVILNEYIAAGFGSLTRLNKKISKMEMNYDNKNKTWRALFSLPLKFRNMSQFVLPIAFAFWDGDKSERGGNKYLSSWQLFKLASFKKNINYLQKISFAYESLPSPEKGKQIFEATCVACHRVGKAGAAPENWAPNLANIGALASIAYLRDSLIEPSQVVVRQLNINRHYNKQVTPDSKRAYPNNETYKWYSLNEKGEKISKMPSFKQSSEEDIKSLVAYLKSLKP